MQYAMLQAYWPRHSRDLLIHTVELHMARNDMRPCSREEAERTVALVPNSSGWAVYDDCADRMDLSAMDGLGRALTRRLEKSGASGTVALGVVVSEEKRLLRLYGRRPCARYASAVPSSSSAAGHFYGHAAARRWRPLLGKREERAAMAKLLACGALHRQKSAGCFIWMGPRATGFRSLELEQPEGMIWLPFRSETTVKQKLSERILNVVQQPGIRSGRLSAPPGSPLTGLPSRRNCLCIPKGISFKICGDWAYGRTTRCWSILR